LPTVSLSTASLRPHEQAAFWREAATRAFVRHSFKSGSGQSFRGEIEAGSLACLSVATFDCEPCTVVRTSKDAARDDHDDIQLCLNVAGKATFIQGDRETTALAGDLVLVDTRRAFTADYRAATVASVITVPRAQIETRLGRHAPIAGHKFDCSNPVVKIVAALAAALPSAMNRVEERLAIRLSEQILDLIVIAYTATTEMQPVAVSSPRLATRLRLKFGIDHLLSNPELNPAMASASAGISIRYANELLAEDGTSLEEHIVMSRLERCRQSLEDHAQMHRSISDIAFSWGFTSIPHFSRRFKSRYGAGPRDYRARFMLSDSGL